MAVGKQEKDFDIEQWAVDAKPKHRGRVCGTCANDKYREWTRKLIALRKAKKTRTSLRDWWEKLRDEAGYELGLQSYVRHVRECEGYSPSDESDRVGPTVPVANRTSHLQVKRASA